MSTSRKARLGTVAVSAALGMMTAGLSGQASAALVACPPSFTTDGSPKVFGTPNSETAASACQYISPSNPSNVANAPNVNAAAFFGFSDWQITTVSQYEPSDGQAGTWTIPSVDFAQYDYMITFKDGEGTNLISFLFNEEFVSGAWNSPFANPPFNELGLTKVKDVSHFSIFRRDPGGGGGGGNVPEPGSLALMGIAMAGIGAMRRRRP